MTQRVMRVTARPGNPAQGIVQLGGRTFLCALGPAGIKALKREGDGATPRGNWPVLRVLYRADRGQRPSTRLPLAAIRPDDGWCDAPSDRNYNRAVRLPYPASHERLWRADHVYDLVVILGHNTRPRLHNRGSAVFLHLSRPSLTPTEGCVAVPRPALIWLLRALRPGDGIAIG